MFVETQHDTTKTISMRVDDEMFHTLKALSNRLNVGTSAIMRLAIASLLLKAREKLPDSWEELKTIVHNQEV